MNRIVLSDEDDRRSPVGAGLRAGCSAIKTHLAMD
jgi:hypothetical protein